MNTYFLQRSEEQRGRIFLDSKINDDCELMQKVEAPHWGAAREQLRPNGIDLFCHKPGYGFFEEPQQ